MKNRRRPILSYSFVKLKTPLWKNLHWAYPQSTRTHLSADPRIMSRVKTSLIQLITDDRLWQRFQENK